VGSSRIAGSIFRSHSSLSKRKLTSSLCRFVYNCCRSECSPSRGVTIFHHRRYFRGVTGGEQEHGDSAELKASFGEGQEPEHGVARNFTGSRTPMTAFLRLFSVRHARPPLAGKDSFAGGERGSFRNSVISAQSRRCVVARLIPRVARARGSLHPRSRARGCYLFPGVACNPGLCAGITSPLEDLNKISR